MDLLTSLQADILKAHDNLNKIEFKVSGNQYTFYYRHLTILEHTRIKLNCITRNEYVKTDGSKNIKEEENDHLYPLNCILEKALDENGKRLFSSTNTDHKQMLMKMSFDLLSYIAAEMAFDITGNIANLDKKAE